MLLVKVFILSCNIFFSSLEFKLPVASINPPIFNLDSSIVSKIFFTTFSLTPFFLRSLVNASVFLGSDSFVKSPSNSNSFNSL